MSLRGAFAKVCRAKRRLDKAEEEFEKEMETSTVMEVVSLVEGRVRPNAIVVWEKNPDYPIVLIRSPHARSYAFVVWGKREMSRRYQLTFQINERYESRRYCVACGCCHPERFGMEPPPGVDKETWDEETEEMRAQFVEKLALLCKQHGIKGLFVRKSYDWKEYFGEMKDLEVYGASYYLSHVRKSRAHSFPFLGPGTVLSDRQ